MTNEEIIKILKGNKKEYVVETNGNTEIRTHISDLDENGERIKWVSVIQHIGFDHYGKTTFYTIKKDGVEVYSHICLFRS